MNKQLLKSSVVSAILTLAIAQSANATLINDDYIGGDEHGWGDVIGDKAKFDTHSMDVELDGNILSVSINTNFAGLGDEKLFSSLTKDKGIGYGDLFLASSWNPYGTAPYSEDNSTNGTEWAVAFSLDDRWTDGGFGSLYDLASDQSDILLSDDFLTGGTFRNGQEIAVDRTDKKAVSSGISWDITGNNINFLIDLTGSALEGTDTIALHWGMTCGNDTIEGAYSVPEPAMLGLLALGLIGIGVSQRKRN